MPILEQRPERLQVSQVIDIYNEIVLTRYERTIVHINSQCILGLHNIQDLHKDEATKNLCLNKGRVHKFLSLARTYWWMLGREI